MDEELTPAAKSLLENAQRHEAPTRQAKARVHAALVGSLGGAAFGTSGTAAAAIKLGLAAKVAGAIAVTALVGGLTWQLAPLSKQTPPVAIQAEPADSPVPRMDQTPAIVAQTHPAIPKSPKRLSIRSASVNDSGPPSELAIETRQIAAIYAQMQNGDAATALSLIATYQSTFPSGALREESEAAHVMALLDLNRKTEACRMLQRLAKRWPSSPHTERLRVACR